MPGFFARLHRLRPTRPRHPLLRVGLALVGLVVLAVLLVFGVFIGLGMLAFSAARRLRRRGTGPAPEARVLDAEYRVVAPRAVSQAR